MKLDLVVTNVRRNGVSGYSEMTVFSVVDLDVSRNFPDNFVCILPKSLSKGSKVTTKFLEFFGDNSVQLATKLLTKALREEDDPEIKREIEKRLKALKPKPES